MSNRRQRAPGFTLLELMVVVAILGILSSIAIPSFRTFQLRSKQAERTIMIASINRAIDDYYVRDARYPTDLVPGQWTILWLTSENPDATPGTTKRPWRHVALGPADGWGNLSLLVEGGVYYSYYGYAYALVPGIRYTYLRARGDLDGDSVVNSWEQIWQYQNDRLQRIVGGNQTAPQCSYANETPVRTF